MPTKKQKGKHQVPRNYQGKETAQIILSQNKDTEIKSIWGKILPTTAGTLPPLPEENCDKLAVQELEDDESDSKNL